VESLLKQFTLRRQDALQAQRAALGRQQPVQHIALGFIGAEDVVAQLLQLRLERVDQRDVVVDLAVEQFVEQHRRPARQPGFGVMFGIPAAVDRAALISWIVTRKLMPRKTSTSSVSMSISSSPSATV
jgi:hypothetical protein